MQNKEKKELLRLKEIVEWQIKIAKDYKIIEIRTKELKNIEKELLKYE